jgi:preprotein translocase subunit YajC
MDQLGAYLPLVVVALALYLLLLAPARRRARAAQQLQAGLAPGDSVMLTSGLFGTVVELEAETVRVEVAPEVVVRVHRRSVGQVINDLPPPGGPQEYDDASSPVGELPEDKDPGVN